MSSEKAKNLAFKRPNVLGVLNMTRDSFSDGGEFLEPGKAVEQGMKLWRAGANFIDIGAQATGPGADMVTAELEIARLEPVITLLSRAGVAVSVDTFRPQVMLTALKLGVEIINDVNGFRDEACIDVVAHSEAKLIVMHSTSAGPQADPQELSADGMVDRILGFFIDRIAALSKAGVGRERLILDPGLGFFLSKDPTASVAVYRGLDKLQALGLPLCLAASRKSFIGGILGSGAEAEDPDAPRPVDQRQFGSLACELFAASRGVQYLRTHAVQPLDDALRVWGSLA